MREAFVLLVVAACGGGGPAEPASIRDWPDQPRVERPDAAPPPDPVIVFDDPGCRVDDTPIECPDDVLPAPPDDQLVRSTSARCFAVPAGGRVRCPTGGATIRLPERRSQTGGDETVEIDPDTLRCRTATADDTWTEAPCPRALLPVLVNVEPTRIAADRCWWSSLEVHCPFDRADFAVELHAEIIDLQVVRDGTQIVVSRGTSDGVARGWIGRVVGLRGDFTLTSCTQHACKATVTHTRDQIDEAGHDVELGPPP